MQMGFNNDVPYKGLVLHIQTEDHGLPAAKVTSHIFFSGAILESRTSSYADGIAELPSVEEKEEYIRRFMKGMHRWFFKRIQSGELDERLPLGEGEKKKRPAPVAGAAALETPVEIIEADGFDVAGELHELGELYELNSRGEPMTSGDFAAAASDGRAWRGLDADAWAEATLIGDRLLAALGHEA